jgi:hypothetical protein
MSEDKGFRNLLWCIPVVGVLVVLFVGCGVLVGLYLQWYIILGVFTLNMLLIMTVGEFGDPDAVPSLIGISAVFWGVVGATYYTSTNQTFLFDFWMEYRHYIFR